MAPKIWNRQIIGLRNIMDHSSNKDRYSLGLDFGTLSVRALLVNLANGQECAVSVRNYPHAVMDDQLPNGKKLPQDFALQHPEDYIDSLAFVIKDVIRKAGIKAQRIKGVGIDFTACTLLPVTKTGIPLCVDEQYKDNPHAYVKLWKHHAAQPQADQINAMARSRQEPFLKRYGGIISSEWLLPKALELIEKDPEIYQAADYLVEAGDWIVFILTGEWKRNSCAAGYKAGYVANTGYYNSEFLHELNPELDRLPSKLGPVYPTGSFAGKVTKAASDQFGLEEGTPVAVASIDAHVAMPACGITKPGTMLMIMGTSTCHLILGEKEILVEGISGIVKDGILEGYIGYEAGQACVGDHFQWVAERITPPEYHQEAKEKGISIQELLTDKMQQKPLTENQLIALDWFNGVRSVLVDSSLTGLIAGFTLATKAEDIYQSLIEATAFGTRKIIETFESSGVAVQKLVATGGIADKNPVLMQIYADITGKEIFVGKSAQAVALGSAMFGALAAGKANGGFDSIEATACRLGGIRETAYQPDPKTKEIYDTLYQKYCLLHDFFGIEHKNEFKR
ncbi:MAG: ribulokinase [Candidatus Izemoplasmatales bacterium]|nr:ribulokinase [Candidatus Izemoplasmatales bacterium]